VKIIAQASGPGHIETYTVKFTKDGRPESAVIYGKSAAGFRFAAQAPADKEVLNNLISQNQVGAAVSLRYDSRRKLNIADII